MQTTVNLPDSLYQKSEALAASRNRDVELPVIRSGRPGTLDLSNFDFDELLA